MTDRRNAIMVKSMKKIKKIKKIIAVALVFTMLFASQVTAFAASPQTKPANKDMSLSLIHISEPTRH